MTSSGDDLSFAGEALDPFAPARVDDTIATALLDPDGALASAEGSTVLALAEGHALPAGADAVIERVRARLAAAPISPATSAEADDAAVAPHTPRHAAPRPVARAQNTLRAMAAVLVVALLAGGFVALLHSRQAGMTPTARWVDVSITQARTTRPLDFDRTNGISYAVAQTGGIIYACSGKSLWYSYDGGVSYAPFAPAPPAGMLDGMCTLGTVPGLPGVFVSSQLPSAEQISYGEPGGTWRTLGFPGAVQSTTIVDPGRGLLVFPVPQEMAHQDISFPLFAPGSNTSHLAQYAGQWLMLIVRQPLSTRQAGAPDAALIATRDFGKTWVWLDATLFSQSHQNCTSFIVAASSSPNLACATENPDALSGAQGLALADDLGQTWHSAASATPEVIAGANASSIYFVQSGKGEAKQLVRYDLAPRSLIALATLPDWPRDPSAPAPPLALMPDGTVYQAFARGTARGIFAGLDAVAPGESHVTRVAPEVMLRAKGLTPTLAFGDLDGTAPALYLGTGNATSKGDISPLYRLALPAPTTPPQWTAVVQFPTVPAPITPHPPAQCAGDPVTTAAIRPGGLGALSATFAPRWGSAEGVALGTTYFGRYGDTGTPIVGVPSTALGPDARVPNLTYHVDSTAHVTMTQAQAIAATILPADVHGIPNGFGTAPPGSKVSGTYTYCSAAFWAAFPPGTPSFTHGELAVTYHLRSDGSVDSVDFSPAIIG